MNTRTRILRLRRCWGVLIASVVTLAPAAALAANPRIAVGLTRAGDLHLPAQFGEGAPTRALAQGVREACLEPGADSPRRPQTNCKTLADARPANVCVEETLEQALSLQVKCDDAMVAAEAIDLSRFGCATADCLRVEARRSGATHLLIVRAVWNDGLDMTASFEELVTNGSRTARPQDFAERYNTDLPRSGTQVLGLLKWFAREIVAAELVLSQRKPVDALGGPPALRVDTAAQRPAIIATPERHVANASTVAPERRAWLGWGLIGLAVGAGAASWLVWDHDGAAVACNAPTIGDPDPCVRVRRTIIPAVGLAAVAVGTAVVGTVVLVRDRHADAKLALSVQRSGVAIGGRF